MSTTITRFRPKAARRRHRCTHPRAVLLLLVIVVGATATAAEQQPPPLPPGPAALAALGKRFPWEVSRAEAPSLPWEGLEGDLAALLKVQARGREVSLVVFNEGFAELALNCIVSLVAYGNSPNYVVTAAGPNALAHCQKLRLPCYDGSRLLQPINATAAHNSGGGEDGDDDDDSSSSSAVVAAAARPPGAVARRRAALAADGGAVAAAAPHAPADADAKRYSADWFQLVWVKTLVAHAVNALGYDILFADADTVFLKDAWRAYNGLLDRFSADGSFMREQSNVTRGDGSTFIHRYLNSGNFALRSNARTRALMDMWRTGYELQANVNGNQLWLNRLEKLGYRLCHERAACEAHRDEGWAAIKPHPNQFAGRGAMCTPDALPEGLCTDRRLYVHAVCREGHHAKVHALRQLGLWFVHVDPKDRARVTVRLPAPGAAAAGGLPCGGPTWEGHYFLSSS